MQPLSNYFGPFVGNVYFYIVAFCTVAYKRCTMCDILTLQNPVSFAVCIYIRQQVVFVGVDFVCLPVGILSFARSVAITFECLDLATLFSMWRYNLGIFYVPI